MSKRLKHEFFDAIDKIAKAGNFDPFDSALKFPKAEFYRALKVAHPFVFDAKCTEEAMMSAGKEMFSGVKFDLEKIQSKIEKKASKVEEFSLQFKTVLYLLTKCPTILRSTASGEVFKYKRIGYLIKELEGPEKIRVFDVMLAAVGADWHCITDFYDVDLTNLEPNFASDVVAISRLSDMISVKRVGIEVEGGFRNLKTKGIGTGFTSVRYDNIFHIADKEEYNYTLSEEGSLYWTEYLGWWRAHWRAFYHENLTDAFGRRVVDYTRTGKNRRDEYVVPGYTWVMEHIKGDPKLAEIRTRIVKSQE
jgi:hypothetical protein